LDFWPVFQRSMMITGLVAVMMMLVEYLNVLTGGSWRKALAGSPWKQYAVAALLGATPGCLGAFVVATLYIHRSVSLGAVVACMVATSGDEAFVMLAMLPRTAIVLSAGLAIVGVVAGLCTDALNRKPVSEDGCEVLLVHEDSDECRCFEPRSILQQLRHPRSSRSLLAVGSALFLTTILSGTVGPAEWGWLRVTLTVAGGLSLFVVTTVPDHFLDDHLWRHVVLQHVPRVFLWTFGALAVVTAFDRLVALESFVRHNSWLMLVLSSLVGIVPESGPHLLFLTLYDHGAVPLSVLAASSIVQDGHGMLPILAASRRDFLKIKSFNLVTGLTVGALLLSVGF
jgi:hypothetical protein